MRSKVAPAASRGPAACPVRSASLLEQREFELPVLFVVSALAKGSKFQRVTALKPIREIAPRAILQQILAETARTSTPFPRAKKPKRTGGSNSLCSTNESVRTAGP